MEEWHKENISFYLIYVTNQIGDTEHIKTWSSVLHKLKTASFKLDRQTQKSVLLALTSVYLVQLL